ncbi:phosphodiesterase [Clostridiales bacterium PH28_bin88]|nr:phosphodiesterase [Clostridiales bacterium PH28_bin88]
MKLGIISDTHGNVAAWREVMERHFSNVDQIIHAGDVLYHGPRNPVLEGYNPAALAEEINRCPQPVLLARGNCDADVDQVMLHFPLISPCILYQVAGYRLMAHHGHTWNRQAETALARRYGLHLVISGHTHIPAVEKVDGTLYFNPGSVSIPLGERGLPTVGVLEDNRIRVLAVTTGETLLEESV